MAYGWHRLPTSVPSDTPPHVVVIGASAGGLDPLIAIVTELPRSLQACVLVVMHTSSNGTGVLPQILARASSLPVAFAEDGDELRPGHIYVARPDYHVIVDSGTLLAVVHGPRENGFRPAIDPLFRTAARQLGPRVIGVILSGALSDGTYGLSMIKHYGGVAIVQDPEEAVVRSMPQSALKYVDVDLVLPAAKIAASIERLVEPGGERKGGWEMARAKDVEPQLQSQSTEVADMTSLFGPPSGLTCPDCGGALWEIEERRVLRYQCHVGHQYAPENLEAGQRDVIDGALWSAVRVLEEHAELKQRLADRAATGGLNVVSEGFAEGAREAREQADRIRSVLLSSNDSPAAKVTARRPPPAAASHGSRVRTSDGGSRSARRRRRRG